MSTRQVSFAFNVIEHEQQKQQQQQHQQEQVVMDARDKSQRICRCEIDPRS